MYLSRVFNRVRPTTQQTRLISNYQTLRDSKATNKPTVVGEPIPNVEAAPEDPTMNVGQKWVTPTNFNKRILVWMKYYKKIDEVPDRVKYGMMEKAQSRFRIRCSNIMMIATLTILFISFKWGKKRSEHGESLETVNEAWHDTMTKD